MPLQIATKRIFQSRKYDVQVVDVSYGRNFVLKAWDWWMPREILFGVCKKLRAKIIYKRNEHLIRTEKHCYTTIE